MTILEMTKNYLNIPLTDVTKDVELNQFIDVARSYIDEYLGRITLLTAHTDIFQGENLPALVTRHWPIDTLTSITSKGVVEPLTDYKAYNDLGKIIKWKDFLQQPISAQYIEVTYSAGWAKDKEPLWLADCIAVTASSLYGQKGTGTVSVATGSVSSETLYGVYSVSYDTSVKSTSTSSESFSQIPAKAKAMLDMHKMRYV